MNPQDQPIEGVGDLRGYFLAAETPRADWAVGTEHEKTRFGGTKRECGLHDNQSS